MEETKTPIIACISSYLKGQQFIKTCKEQGAKTILITNESLKEKDWPWESIDETFYIPGDQMEWDMDAVTKGMAFMLRHHNVDRFVALDDFDVEKVAHLREEFRMPGIGATQARYFRDKLAMRLQAEQAGLNVPAFTAVINNDVVNHFCDTVPAPWVLKPRSSASAIGIKKVESKEQLWELLNKAEDERHGYVLEKFLPGDVYHVDSLSFGNRVVFARAHKYMNPPFEVAHEGRVFRSHNLEHGSAEEKEMVNANKDLLKAFGLQQGASHTEFIKAHEDGKVYFLETSARVGGANIVEMVEASSGINLWTEWAKMECALAVGEKYKIPKAKKDYSGIIMSLAKQAEPDTSAYSDEEIFWRQTRDYHAGLIIRSPKQERILELMEQYANRFYEDFFAFTPMGDKPTN